MASPIAARADRYAIAVLMLLVIASWAPRFRGPIDLRWDAAVYYVLGTSLAEGKGYRLLNEPGEIQAVLYPPLLPAIVAAHQRAIGTVDPVVVGAGLRVFFFLLSAAYVAATYVLLRGIARLSFAFAGTMVVSLTFLPIWLSDRCYTDVPFALSCTVFVLLGRRGDTARRELMCWTTATAAFLLRTIGAALFASWIAESLVARNYRRAATRGLLALVPIVAWQLYVQHVVSGPEYNKPAYTYQRADYNIYNVTYGQLFSLRDHLNPGLGTATPGDRLRRLPQLAATIVPGLGGAISAPVAEWEGAVDRFKRLPVLRFVPWRTIPVVLTLLAAMVLAGLAIQLTHGRVRVPIAVAVYLAALCLMPPSYFYELPRYLAAIGPLLMASALEALTPALRLRTRASAAVAAVGTTLAAGVGALVLVVGALTVARGYIEDLRSVVHRDWNGRQVNYRLFSYEEDYEAFDRALEWLAERASPRDVVASTTPHWVYLRTGLQAVMPPFEGNTAAAHALFDSVPVRYVIVSDWLSRRHALPAMEQGGERWRRVYSTAHCAIYQRVSGGE